MSYIIWDKTFQFTIFWKWIWNFFGILQLLYISVFKEKINEVHVCLCLLDLAIYLHRTNPHKIPERELVVRRFSDFMPKWILTLDLRQYEWNGSYCLETISIDDLVPNFNWIVFIHGMKLLIRTVAVVTLIQIHAIFILQLIKI